MDSWLSFVGDLFWSLPWRNPLGKSRAHNRQSEMRLRVALESELQRREDITSRKLDDT